jgi:hypothetical protein
MRVLSEKETDLITMAVIEGLIETQNKLWVDFNVDPNVLTVHQKHRLDQIENLLYTLFCEVVEENGVLQYRYDR